MRLSHNIFLQNNFSYLHPNAIYQAFAFRAMDIQREHSFIIRNALIPTISLAYISFLKKRKKQITLTLPKTIALWVETEE